ncbi:hypothetical protein L208DRAFT_1426440 [Tricholoma matsutake]|nr:hypothetical protein L208DRAFT_1426440 [Tricholoma matsutake 945]
MTPSDHNRTSTKFYQQDLVQRITSPNSFGIVLRCWHDAEDVPPLPPLSDLMMRQLQPGEVGVSFLGDGGEREILPESELRLIDRTIPPGDFCKRSVDDVRSGVVINARVKGRIEHVISGEPIGGWKTLDELEDRGEAEIGDYVVYDDWIGQLFDESVIEVATGQLIRLPELSSRLAVGEKGTDILPPQSHGVYNLFGFLLGTNRPSGVDTVIAVKHTVYAVVWLAVNQSLESSIAETKTRPQRFWFGEDIAKITLIRGRSELQMRVGDRIRPKDTTELPSTRHSQLGDNADVITVQTFIVTETETTLDVLWQDGVHETLASTEVIPYLNPDEYDCWPGDHVVWKRESEKRPAIVQCVNAAERTAAVLLPDTGVVELVSVLELDPHGTSDLAAVIPQSASEGLGVRRGDFVFIHREGTTNGFQKPSVPRIGELEAWVRECPIVDGQLIGWRKEMSEIGGNIAGRSESDRIRGTQLSLPVPGSGCLSWFGEVTGLNLDGTVEITHPDSTLQVYPLERLTKLYDGIEQIEDDLWGDPMDIHASYAEDEDQIWSMDENGVWQPEANGSEWEEFDDDVIMNDDTGIDTVGWADEVVHDGPASPTSSESAPFSMPHVIPHPLGDNAKYELAWKRFDILPCAPRDHAYFSSVPSQPSKSFLGRLTKEYRVLSSSLPDSIIVRAYEDRADLLRCLILGPANTPYEDAPFVIDWMLDSNFPQSPPIAHFHSWTNGNGREGKVCLSILGTWAGDRNETWGAARSSLLQAFVSIQGLVLVKEPWFCEPAYDKLRGTEEGIVNSRLYNEKAYVLSRGFVRRALEMPLGGLESEIKWLYYEHRHLEKVLRDAKMLIEKSKATTNVTEADEELAVPRLTAGGILTLERILGKLQLLSNSDYSSSSL